MEAGALRLGRLLAFLLAVGVVAGWAADANAIFFNLHGLSPAQSISYSMTADGITVSVLVGSTGKLTSGASTFGLDATAAGDDPALIDGGSGSAENFSISVSQSVLFESMLISSFDSVDHGTFNIKGGTTVTLANGINDVNDIAGFTSANILSWTGDKLTGGGRGFSVDGFTVRPLINNSYLAGDFNADGRVDAEDYIV
jgi:hypothetical protein